MRTYFADPDRDFSDSIKEQVTFLSQNPVLNSVLQSSSGLLAILNEKRQILAVNTELCSFLGIEKPEELFGARPGEALNCQFAHEEEGGCGTSKYCSSCGAAIAIVSALENNSSEERKCVLRVTKKDSSVSDICFKVKASRITIQDKPYIIIYVQDISETERRAALEKAFLHDMKNIVTGINWSIDLIDDIEDEDVQETLEQIKFLSDRMRSELIMQEIMVNEGKGSYKPRYETIILDLLINDLRKFLNGHLSVRDKQLELTNKSSLPTIKTDRLLLLRVLTNMLLNALEASQEGEKISLTITDDEGHAFFSVHNNTFMPPAVAGRVFQRHFSTKDGMGRGFGTYSMKICGEHFLGGAVSFTSTPEDGTTFVLKLPI